MRRVRVLMAGMAAAVVVAGGLLVAHPRGLERAAEAQELRVTEREPRSECELLEDIYERVLIERSELREADDRLAYLQADIEDLASELRCELIIGF